MRISYTPEQEELRRELRSYFAKLITPERREALNSTAGEIGVGNVYRETVAQMGRDGWLALGKLYTFRNDVLNIIRVYRRVLEIDPEYADAYYNLGIAYYNDGQADEAIRFFERAIALANQADSHFYLGMIYVERGETDRAIASFRERIRLRQGAEDAFAEEARKTLEELLRQKEDGTP